jgi:hypothetical protein
VRSRCSSRPRRPPRAWAREGIAGEVAECRAALATMSG